MKRIFILSLLCVTALAQTPEDRIRKVQEVLLQTKTLVADFVTTNYSTTVSLPLVEHGKVWMKAPDSMKWSYHDPEEKIFLVTGSTYQMYVPEDNQLYRGAINAEDRQGDVMNILSGRMDILEGYRVEDGISTGEKEIDTAIYFKLTPKGEDHYSFILLDVDRQTLRISKIVFFDWAGSRQEITFSGIQTNIPISSDVFNLEVPPDVEIIDY